ncbi:MAG: class I SAM-dependent methyltransferase [Mesorhizobium sp.]|nr:class I SAM-dependent methyltransferase [Mesorhizobium sp. M7A.F.Ca.MR.245.00.0.0]RUV48914.1 class I SAM-dependent methyltransferase [Mesorhizobium sp. M7A.F.Ca.MR.228.00.0.0]RWN42686.1 MAG: class I SAM-dependent methyltransferase [Mesorhizobium sp.]
MDLAGAVRARLMFNSIGVGRLMEEKFRIIRDEAEIAELSKKTRSPLADLFFNRSSKAPSMKWLHYLDIYDRYLSPYRNLSRPLHFLEIGIADGGSFNVWRPYFGERAILFGIDISPSSAVKVESLGMNCHGRVGSQADPKFLASIVEEMGGLDIVIDDGSHIAEHQLASFRTLFPLLSNGGVYICEDLHTAYWEDWQGGLRRPGTFIEVVKDIIDCLHAWYAPIDNSMSDMVLHRSIPAIHLHDSLAVIEKAVVEPPLMLIK